jgi:hypothetical protein
MRVVIGLLDWAGGYRDLQMPPRRKGIKLQARSQIR